MMTRNNSQCCLIYVPQMSRVPFVTFRTQFNCLSACPTFVFGAWLSPFRRAWQPLSEIWHKFMRRHQNDDDVAGAGAAADNDESTATSTSSSIAIKNLCFRRAVCLQLRWGSSFSVLCQSSVLDVCSGVCLVKRNLAALLKFPARYLVAQQSSSRLRVTLDEATEQRQIPQPKQRQCRTFSVRERDRGRGRERDGDRHRHRYCIYSRIPKQAFICCLRP